MISLIVLMVFTGCKTTESLTTEQRLWGQIAEITPETRGKGYSYPDSDKEVWFGYCDSMLLVQEKDDVSNTGDSIYDNWENALRPKKVPIFDAFAYPMIVYSKSTRSWLIGYPQLSSDLRGNISGFGNQVGGDYGMDYSGTEPVWLLFINRKGIGKAKVMKVKNADCYWGANNPEVIAKLRDCYHYGYWRFSKEETYEKYVGASENDIVLLLKSRVFTNEPYENFPLRSVEAADAIFDLYDQVKNLGFEEGKELIESYRQQYNPEGSNTVRLIV